MQVALRMGSRDAARYLDTEVAPRLRNGLLEEVFVARGSSCTSEDTNRAVEQVLVTQLKFPEMLRTVILGDHHHITGGQLWDMRHDFRVLDGARGGLRLMAANEG